MFAMLNDWFSIADLGMSSKCPKADREVSVLLIEPKGVRNTGSVGGLRTTEVGELL